MARIEILDSGILFVNPDPSRYHVFASHAHPLQLSEREFVSTYQRGSALYAADLQMAITRSLDGGRTWQDEGAIQVQVEAGAKPGPYSYHDGFLSQLSDGTLVILTFRVDRSGPDRPMFSPTGGLSRNDAVLLFSRDGGRTWTSQLVPLPPEIVATPANPVIELADGRWLTTFDRWHGYDEPGPYRPQMFALISADRGRTWGHPILMADHAKGIGYWHGKAIPLADGRFYATYWAADLSDDAKGPIDLPLHYSFVDRVDQPWPDPLPTAIPAQTHWPAVLPDGRLALVYTWRITEHPGFMAVLSEDGGHTWDLDHQVRLWDSTGWTHLGIHAPDVYPHSHDTIAFGAPALLTTLDGDLYASWWCTYASITHIRWARLRVVS